MSLTDKEIGEISCNISRLMMQMCNAKSAESLRILNSIALEEIKNLSGASVSNMFARLVEMTYFIKNVELKFGSDPDPCP